MTDPPEEQFWLMCFTQFSPYSADLWRWEPTGTHTLMPSYDESWGIESGVPVKEPTILSHKQLARDVANNPDSAEWHWQVIGYKAWRHNVWVFSFCKHGP